jgi:hypothetical protein
MSSQPERDPVPAGKMRRVCDASYDLTGEVEFRLDSTPGVPVSRGSMRRVCDASYDLKGEPDETADAGQPVLFLTLHLPADVDAATVAIETTRLVDAVNQLDKTYGGSGLSLDRPRSHGSEGAATLALRPTAAGNPRADADRLGRVAAAIANASTVALPFSARVA